METKLTKLQIEAMKAEKLKGEAKIKSCYGYTGKTKKD